MLFVCVLCVCILEVGSVWCLLIVPCDLACCCYLSVFVSYFVCLFLLLLCILLPCIVCCFLCDHWLFCLRLSFGGCSLCVELCCCCLDLFPLACLVKVLSVLCMIRSFFVVFCGRVFDYHIMFVVFVLLFVCVGLLLCFVGCSLFVFCVDVGLLFSVVCFCYVVVRLVISLLLCITL